MFTIDKEKEGNNQILDYSAPFQTQVLPYLYSWGYLTKKFFREKKLRKITDISIQAAVGVSCKWS